MQHVIINVVVEAEKLKHAKLVLLISLILGFFILSASSARAEQICIYFFYREGCSECTVAQTYIGTIQKTYPNVVIHEFEIGNSSNAKLLVNLWDAYNVPDENRTVPIVFISNKYFVGTDIISSLGGEIDSLQSVGCNCPSIKGGGSPLNPSRLSFLVITGAALVDSFNPCAIAILLLLLGSLTLVKQAKKVYRAGLVYIITVFITYFLIGLGLYTFLHLSGFSYFFYQVIGIVAIVIGVLNIKDFLWPGGGGFAIEIPKRWQPYVEKLVRKIGSPVGAFLIGCVVALFELPCTGGPYIFILGLLAQTTTRPIAVLMLLYYNFIFVLPLIIITILFYFGHSRSVKRTFGTQRKDVKRLLHLLAGILMLILGVVVILRLI
jgi:cytochrome c biogenesis protein CcdA/glutaredoxin